MLRTGCSGRVPAAPPLQVPITRGAKRAPQSTRTTDRPTLGKLVRFIVPPCVSGLSIVGLDAKPKEKQERSNENFGQQELAWAGFSVVYEVNSSLASWY